MRRWFTASITVLAIVVCALLVSGASASLVPQDHRAATTATLVAPPAAPPPFVCLVAAPAAPSITLDPAQLIFGEPVRVVQSALGITADGVYGPITSGAVQALVLPADGCSITAGQQTALDALTALQAAQDDLTAQYQAALALARANASQRPSGFQSPAPAVFVASDQGANIALGQSMAAGYGWTGGQWQCLLDLWGHESGWRTEAHNASGAHGIPQALPGDKMGPGWENDASVQISWGLGYIQGRYGDPCGALGHWASYNWY